MQVRELGELPPGVLRVIISDPGFEADTDAQKRVTAALLVAKPAGIRVQVEENPIVNRVAFEGNSKISDDNLRPELTLRPRAVFTATRSTIPASRTTGSPRSKATGASPRASPAAL